jgi:hypothetical protein
MRDFHFQRAFILFKIFRNRVIRNAPGIKHFVAWNIVFFDEARKSLWRDQDKKTKNNFTNYTKARKEEGKRRKWKIQAACSFIIEKME